MPEIHLVVNGAARTLGNVATITELLATLEIKGRLAVEVNGEIVPRSRFSEYQLQGNDVIEIVRAIGGG
jgi:sulfur carrier protein